MNIWDYSGMVAQMQKPSVSGIQLLLYSAISLHMWKRSVKCCLLANYDYYQYVSVTNQQCCSYECSLPPRVRLLWSYCRYAVEVVSRHLAKINEQHVFVAFNAAFTCSLDGPFSWFRKLFFQLRCVYVGIWEQHGHQHGIWVTREQYNEGTRRDFYKVSYNQPNVYFWLLCFSVIWLPSCCCELRGAFGWIFPVSLVQHYM